MQRVWEKKNNTKVNIIIEEISEFAKLEEFMKSFEYNLINNIHVPTEAELKKRIDVFKAHEHLGFLLQDNPYELKLFDSMGTKLGGQSEQGMKNP